MALPGSLLHSPPSSPSHFDLLAFASSSPPDSRRISTSSSCFLPLPSPSASFLPLSRFPPSSPPSPPVFAFPSSSFLCPSCTPFVSASLGSSHLFTMAFLAEQQSRDDGTSSFWSRRNDNNQNLVVEDRPSFENDCRELLSSDASQDFLGPNTAHEMANGLSSSLPTVNGSCPSFARQNGAVSSTEQSGDGALASTPQPTDDRPVLEEEDELWLKMRAEARRDAELEPVLASYLYSTILAHRSLERALAFHLGNKLCSTTLLSTQLYNLIVDTFMDDAGIREAVRGDIKAVRERDPACVSYSQCMLNFKGFLACQAYRVAHRLWNQGRISLALAIQSRISEVFAVDIHPAAKIGKGILLDHATGVVIGETAMVGDNVSILHNVTLGGTGKYGGDRHPKIGNGVLIGAGATILGNITIGEGAKIGAGSVVLIEVPPKTTAVGNPARLLGGKAAPSQLKDIPGETMDHTSFISEWSDYVI